MLREIKSRKILLIILDGWGHATTYHGNAIKQARTPTIDFLWNHYPKTLLNASEKNVGLPDNQVGNSEVGHTTIGAGRVIDQALVRISKYIQNGSFFTDKILNKTFKITSKNSSKLHLIGLCSDGGVHSHINHLIELLKLSKQYTSVMTHVHIITDGRDTKPQSAKKFISKILNFIENYPNIIISTISGRYYSMDRDCRWQRTEKSYKCLVNDNVNNENISQRNIFDLIDESYTKNIYDEFILPTRINKGKIEKNDSIIFFNFRPDRMRQLVQAFCNRNFKGFKTQWINNLNVVTFTMYDSQLKIPVIFNNITMNNFLGQIISDAGLKQFRLAETEKYAHVTYFFNGGREEPFPGEDRALIPSPHVDTYDLTPKMSASKISKKIIEASQDNQYNLMIVNYANSDMLGHTGNFRATKKSIEYIDKCLNETLKKIDLHETITLLTADHGNADMMLDKNNRPNKSHTKNPVPLIIVNNRQEIKNFQLEKSGSLADIAPTILDLFHIDKPYEMDGCSLLIKRSKNFVNQSFNVDATHIS